MLENSLEIIFALTGVFWISNSLISSFKSYAYVKKNLSSISNLFFGDPQYFKKLDWTSFFLIETITGIIAAVRLRELKLLKRDTIFSKGQISFAPHLNEKKLNLFLREHEGWYKLVVRNLILSSVCLPILMIIYLILK